MRKPEGRQRRDVRSLPSTSLAGRREPPPGEAGLSEAEARSRLAKFGPNQLVPEHRRPALLAWLLRPFADPMVLLLLLAGGTYWLLGDYADAAVTLAAVVPIMLVSLVLEAQADRALDQLKQLTAPRSRAWRGGHLQLIPTEELVPGDLVSLQEGDIVPADGVLVEGAQLVLDESALTGESQPAVRDAGGAPVERELLAGTTVLAGRGALRVVSTGARTRYGQIGTLMATIPQPATPLQRLIRRLVRQLAAAALIICVAVGGLELIYGHGWIDAITAGVSLAIAAIPEEFPMVFTLYLALGAWRLARRHALVRRLVGVETLGATTVICTDKTGTLTQGRLEVAGLATAEGIAPVARALTPSARAVVEAAVLASEPNPFDPLDQAILRFAAGHGIDVTALHRGHLLEDYPFDPAGKHVSHVWRRDGNTRIFAKGAPEGMLDRSQATAGVRQRAVEANQALASQSLRVVAVAAGDLDSTAGNRSADERHLQLLGLIAFSDPVRDGVDEALRECRQAGVRVIMITGDQPITAHAVAEELGLRHDYPHHVATGDELDAADEATLVELVDHVNIFARTRPEQKCRLVRALKARGQVVAMTGDGINDAPALREADIGVAMGRRGTEVARTAATMVLLDDNFATIVSAIREGRRIFENLRRAFSYLIAFHTPLLLGALIVPLLGAPLLLRPLHLVWLELIVHPTASLVFDGDPPSPDLMRRPPRRPGAGLLAGLRFLRPLAAGSSLFGGVLGLYLVRLAQDEPETHARAAALAALVVGQVVLVLSERSPGRPFWCTNLQGNRALPAILAATALSLLAALYLPPLAGLLDVAPLSIGEWAVAVAVALATTVWVEGVKTTVTRSRQGKRGGGGVSVP